MLNSEITRRALQWASSPDCPVRALLDHIHIVGRLRPPQIEAIIVWAYLKIAGEGKPLGTLFTQGFFTSDLDLDSLSVPVATREALEADPALLALYDFASARTGADERLPDLAERIRESPDEVDAQAVVRAVFYDEDYTDYLFSLPMGAGKTFLIAALIHLELYFAVQAPDNPAFARNFLVLIPSGLKSSIGPSLRTIEHFDPTWVLPEPAASDVHRMIRLDVLDEAKSAKKSNKARNPNAARVAACAPFEDAEGHVFIVNAEKVILNRVPKDPDQFELVLKSDDDKDREENELRNLLGKLPRLGIHIDEVHHAKADDIKLRQVVNRWAERGDVTAAYGYSGTPYLKKAETIEAEGVRLKFQQITNTVYHYPLTTAIEGFLETPTVKVAEGAESMEIVHRGVEDFYETYGDTVYADGTRAKLAVYCSNIARLEEEVRPFLTGTLGVPEADVLVYHKGKRPIPKRSAVAYGPPTRPSSPPPLSPPSRPPVSPLPRTPPPAFLSHQTPPPSRQWPWSLFSLVLPLSPPRAPPPPPSLPLPPPATPGGPRVRLTRSRPRTRRPSVSSTGQSPPSASSSSSRSGRRAGTAGVSPASSSRRRGTARATWSSRPRAAASAK